MNYIVVYNFLLSRSTCFFFFLFEHNTISANIKPNVHRRVVNVGNLLGASTFGPLFLEVDDKFIAFC